MNRLCFILCIIGLSFLQAIATRADSIRPSRLDSTLQRLAGQMEPQRAALARQEKGAVQSAREQFEQKGLKADAQARIQVVISGADHSGSLPKGLLKKFGGERMLSWRNQHKVWIPVPALKGLAAALPDGFFIRPVDPPTLDQVGGEGANVMNTTNYLASGVGGQGVVLGIIDGGYSNLNQTVTSGDAPPAGQILTIQDYNRTNFNISVNAVSALPGDHGTKVLESAFDHAPNANYILYIATDPVDIGLAVEHAVSNDVDILCMSQSRYPYQVQTTPGEGWFDNSGLACLAAQVAASNDIPFFVSAGNRATTHWKGPYNNPTPDSFHRWAGGDTLLSVDIDGNEGARFSLAWQPVPFGNADYDLFLLDSNGTAASSTNAGGDVFEGFWYSNPSSNDTTFEVFVTHNSGFSGDLELFVHGAASNFEFPVPESSTTSPSNTDDPLVISVGAINWTNYSAVAGTTNIIEGFSSRGPSNSGMILPDITGPDAATTFIDGQVFGTSYATPAAAGAAAALWSASPGLSAEGLVYLIKAKAAALKDWGDPGKDNIYGEGGFLLYPYHTNTLWVDARSGNSANDPGEPFASISAAQSNAFSGGRTVFFGQSYDETLSLDVPQRYETILVPARVGAP